MRKDTLLIRSAIQELEQQLEHRLENEAKVEIFFKGFRSNFEHTFLFLNVYTNRWCLWKANRILRNCALLPV